MDVVIAAGGAAWEQAAIGEVEASPALRLVRRCVDVADLLAAAQTGQARAAIVAVDLPGLDVEAVARLGRSGVLVAAIGADEARCEALGIRRTLHIGRIGDIAHDVLVRPAGAPASHAPVVAVWGPTGAPGRSTVALALASAAAARGVDTVLVDADTYGGALGQLLSVLDDVSGLVAACRAANQGRAGEALDHLLAIDPALRLLTGLPRADMWPQVRESAFASVLDRVRGDTELVVVDIAAPLETGTGPGPARNQTALQVVAAADLVVVVGRPDPVGLARLVRGVQDLSAVAPGAQHVIAINMMRASLGWREREVRATVSRLTGTEPVVHLPFDQSALDLAAVKGRAPREAAPSSPFVARIEVLTGHVLTAVVSPGALAGPAA